MKAPDGHFHFARTRWLTAVRSGTRRNSFRSQEEAHKKLIGVMTKKVLEKDRT